MQWILLCVLAAGAAGSLSGVVTFEGVVPERTLPDYYGQRRPLLEVDPKTKGLANAVVYLRPVKPAQAGLVPDAMLTIDQEDYEFVPRVLSVRAGQKVSIGNNDPANHNVRTETKNPENTFNIITPVEKRHERSFALEPEERPVRLGCDIHPWMTAWVFVFDHDFHTVTGKDGSFTITDVPDGAYTLVVQQPDGRLRAESPVEIHAGSPLHATIRFTGLKPEERGKDVVTVIERAGE